MSRLLAENNQANIKKYEDKQILIFKRRLLKMLDGFYKDKFTHYNNVDKMLICWRVLNNGKEYKRSMYYPPSLNDWLKDEILNMEQHKATLELTNGLM
jgi:GT2 family glycosyltransferase